MAKLQITGRMIEDEVTARLQSIRPSKLRARYAPQDLDGAICSAARCAMKSDVPMYIYGGNAYGRAMWRVTYKLNEALCPINNSSGRLFEVAADRTFTRLLIGPPA